MPEGFFTPSRAIVSPPPASVVSSESSDDEAAEDPFSAGSDGTTGSTEDESTRQNTLSNSAQPREASQPPSGMPLNPFKKTLASLTPTGEQSPQSHNSERRSQGAEPTIDRPLYDVDDFKRLLLTGEKNSAPNAARPPPVSFQSHHSAADSSSNTDASSISRQSLFEPSSGPLQESPGTSQEGSPTDDERQQLVGGQLPSSQRIKPSTPRPRHGKLVKVNGPQTVSFEDPSLSFSSSGMDATLPVSRSMPTSPGTPVYTEKPLPPLPSDTALNSGPPAEASNAAIFVPKQETNSDSAIMPQRHITQNRDPPAPPLSRRHSQLKAKPIPGSERSPLISEEDSAGSARSPPSTAWKPPPPPPPRRAGAPVRVNSSSSISTNAYVPPTQSQSSPNEISPTPLKSRPPVPPNSSPSISSVKRQSTQPSSGSPAIAPPPPPRRRGSSQSSNFTPSRLSGDYRTAVTERLRSDSGASSISHLQMTPPTTTPGSGESKDVMADITALQREVDELRGKFRD